MARPRKSETELHHNRLSVYLTDEDDLLIRQLAARKGIPPGVLGRALLVSKLDQLTTALVEQANACLYLVSEGLKMKILDLDLDEIESAQLLRFAQAHGLSLSEAARRLLAARLTEWADAILEDAGKARDGPIKSRAH